VPPDAARDRALVAELRAQQRVPAGLLDRVEVLAVGVLHQHRREDLVGAHVASDDDGDLRPAQPLDGVPAAVAGDDEQLPAGGAAGDDGLQQPDGADGLGELGHVADVLARVGRVGVQPGHGDVLQHITRRRRRILSGGDSWCRRA